MVLVSGCVEFERLLRTNSGCSSGRIVPVQVLKIVSRITVDARMYFNSVFGSSRNGYHVLCT